MNESKLASTTATVLIIGSGRLTKHLQNWLMLNSSPGVKLLTWDRHQDPHVIHKYVLQATHIWLAISDTAIIPFYEKFILGHDVRTVHFSGALHDDRIISAHPLMSFSNDIYEDSVYEKIQFALTGCENLNFALPGFKNHYFILPAENKSFYHALCVMAGNFPQMLWSEILIQAKNHNIPLTGFDLYLDQVTKNFISNKGDALTGPFARKDFQTIDKNIESLENTKLESIYKKFKKEFLP